MGEGLLVQEISVNMVSISYVGPVCKGVHQPLVYVYASICEPDSVYWYSRYLCSKGEGGGVSQPWVYVHSSIFETYLV